MEFLIQKTQMYTLEMSGITTIVQNMEGPKNLSHSKAIHLLNFYFLRHIVTVTRCTTHLLSLHYKCVSAAKSLLFPVRKSSVKNI